MTRPIPAPLLTELTRSPLAGECVVLRSRGGVLAGFTTLSRAISIDLSGDGGPGPVDCTHGMVLSAVTLAAGLEASFAELQGPLGPVLTRAAMEGGAWADAEAWLVRVVPGVAGYAPLLAGKVREARVEDPRFVLEIRNGAEVFNQPLEQLITPYCRLRFGSARCGATPVFATATVTGVTDPMRFAVSYAGAARPDDFFNWGEVEFTSGALNGVIAENLFKWDAAGAGAASLVLQVPLPVAPQVGDTLIVRQGCPKTRPACKDRQPGGDVTPFEGFPDVPGEDVLLYPNPGTVA